MTKEVRRRKSVRLKEFEYAQAGVYFITICTADKQHLFGEVSNEHMILNSSGMIAKEEWLRSPVMRNDVELDVFVVMPNHFHALLFLHDLRGGTLLRARRSESFGKPTNNSLPTIVRLFKSSVTTRVNTLRNSPGIAVWQRGYHEHVVRNERELNEIREYIINNPAKWTLDRYFDVKH